MLAFELLLFLSFRVVAFDCLLQRRTSETWVLPL
jgi:hypothetical protein